MLYSRFGKLDFRISYGEEVECSDSFYHGNVFKSPFESQTTGCQNPIA